MSSMYYLTLSVAALSIAIYNFSVSGEGKSLQCYTTENLTYAQYIQYNNSLNNITTPNADTTSNSTNSSQYYIVQATSSNSYGIMILILSIIYIALCLLSFILCLIIGMLENQLPEDFLKKIGWYKKTLAVCCKLLPPIFILLHWIAMIIIIIIWILLITNTCSIAVDTTAGSIISKGKYFTDVKTLNIINTCIWILIHYGGAMIREISYIEPFMYSPDLGAPSLWKSILIKKLGP